MSLQIFYRIVFWMTFVGLSLLFIDFGFHQSLEQQVLIDNSYFFILFLGLSTTLYRYFREPSRLKKKAFYFDLITIVFTFFIFKVRFFNGFDSYYSESSNWFDRTMWCKLAIIFAFIREYSELNINFKRAVLNPAQVFIISFLSIILFGSVLLLLPNATVNGISFMDALFTSTSAVCVTGLIVLDTSSDFTQFGQTIILLLIQLGGLGILTFASYFSYFFKGGTTYENRLALGDMTSSGKLGEVFSMLKYIILITFGIELFSAIMIYSSLDSTLFSTQFDMFFFSVFHSISAFCNAGFSTLSAGLYDDSYRFNYFLQIILILTFVFGGLGFPIVANILSYLKYRLSTLFSSGRRLLVYKPWVLSLNSRITLITTFSITAVSFLIFYALEYNNTLQEHNGFGKIVAALFGATTPRTAGFNTLDNASMEPATILVVILLMWIGASPQSTGGGIKTSTFAIATLNILSLAKGKSRIELFRREIADISVKRAFAIISLSLIVIGIAILLLTALEPEVSLMELAFEVFSAYSTVGLSLGITADLSSASKFVLIVVMFVGRISMLSFVIAVFKKVKHNNYKYPTEEITMN
jgi:trk system potassium uptake protein TrkH